MISYYLGVYGIVICHCRTKKFKNGENPKIHIDQLQY